MMDAFDIIDISQPISSATACFPGDVPFSRTITLSHTDTGVLNLTAFTMSPHVGTHADAPVHVRGSLQASDSSASGENSAPAAYSPTRIETPGKKILQTPAPSPLREHIGDMPLSPFIGPALVVDVSPWQQEITWEQVREQLSTLKTLPPRILFKTSRKIRYDVFEKEYAWFSVDLVEALAERGVVLMGLDTPSVDHVASKTLETHHALLTNGMAWLENLDFNQLSLNTETESLPANTKPKPASPQAFFLVALPLRMMELEASPVRAVLLKSR